MIALASDHAGFELKEHIKAYLEEKSIPYKDYGTYYKDSVDYPKYASLCANAVASGECEKGLLFCGTGIGISIAANKIDGIRCCACSDVFSAKLSREHNDSNILALGARVVGFGLAEMIVDAWLNTPYSNDPRHTRRINLISDIEKNRK